MKVTKILLCVTIVAIFPGPLVSVFNVVQVKYHEAASLTCVHQCSSVVQWHRAANMDVLAWCNQTSCMTERGYELRLEQIIGGNLSLVVTLADFSRRGWYTCSCGTPIICRVSLRVTPRRLPTPMRASGSLSLDLPVRERVDVIYKSTADADQAGRQICTVDGRSLRCTDEYKDRAALVCNVELRDLKVAPGESFIIKDTENDEIIETHVLTTVMEEPPPPVQEDPKPEEWDGPDLINTLALLLSIAVMIIIVLSTVIMRGPIQQHHELGGNQS